MAVGTQRLTAAQFEEFAARPEHADRHFELIAGEVHEVVCNSHCSEIAANILAEIRMFSKRHKLGRVTGEHGGYVIGDERYMPDVAFVSAERQPTSSHDSWNPNTPNLVVEVISPSDQQQQITIKLGNYLAAGVRVWIVYPDTRTIHEFVPGQPVRIVGEDGTLSGGDILPGFELKLSEIFPE